MADDETTKLSWAAAGAWTSVALLIILILQVAGVWGWLWRVIFGITPLSLPSFGLGWLGNLSARIPAVPTVSSSIGAVLSAVILFAPDMAVLGGFVADAANAEFRYSVTSFLGLAAAVLNWLTTFLTGKGGQTTEYSLGGTVGMAPAAVPAAPAAPAAAAAAAAAAPTAIQMVADSIGVGTTPAVRRTQSLTGSIPGTISTLGTDLGGGPALRGGARLTGNPSSILGIPLGSKAQPAGLAVLAAIVTIYTIDAMSGKRFGAALGLQVAIGICMVLAYGVSYYYTEGFGASWYLPFISVLIGVSIGMIYFALPDKYHPLDPEQTPNPSGEFSKCAAGGGNGEFVCDAYLNGQRIGTVPT
jgi:hypothetical protein